ncbi:hypothetical protein [Roseivirga thermotolerans]|uniref:hypothetical protein n=1 Tax=Roseivirga thermotolerans TaxID=1758176 RepID=UPI00273EBE9B|nr:hypothetical protein [Roseivirga thermotolerans]
MLSTQKIENIEVENFNSESSRLHEKLENEYSLIYFFENGMCQACVEKELKNFRTILSNLSIPIVGIFKGYSSNYLRNDPSFQGLKEHMFIASDYPTETKNLTGTPFIAIVNAQHKVITANHASKIDNLAFEYFLDVVRSISKN